MTIEQPFNPREYTQAEAQSFMSRFSDKPEDWQKFTEMGWGGHLHRVIAKIAISSTPEIKHDLLQLYVAERMADPAPTDHGSSYRAGINAQAAIKYFVDDTSIHNIDDLCLAIAPRLAEPY